LAAFCLPPLASGFAAYLAGAFYPFGFAAFFYAANRYSKLNLKLSGVSL
jgi:hypothetical protein